MCCATTPVKGEWSVVHTHLWVSWLSSRSVGAAVSLWGASFSLSSISRPLSSATSLNRSSTWSSSSSGEERESRMEFSGTRSPESQGMKLRQNLAHHCE